MGITKDIASSIAGDIIYPPPAMLYGAIECYIAAIPRMTCIQVFRRGIAPQTLSAISGVLYRYA